MNKIASKIFNIIGIMYQLKHMVPSEIRLTIYNGLIKSHLIYGLKCWGFNQDRILKLQKKTCELYVRVLTSLTASRSLRS